MQAFKVPSSETPGHTAIYRHPDFKDGTQGSECAHIKTLHDLFRHAAGTHPERDLLGARRVLSERPALSFGEYEWMGGQQALDAVDEIGSGLDHVFAQHAPAAVHGGQQPLGIYSVNRPEWLLAEFAAFRSRRYSVGICDAVGVESAEFIIGHAEVAVVVCSLDKIPRMLERLDRTPGLRAVVSMDRLDCSRPTVSTQAFSPAVTAALRERAQALGVALMDLDDVRKLGRDRPTEPTPPSPEDLYTVCYTSGTTGAQKGVMISHASAVHAGRAFWLASGQRDSTYISFIPLVHSFDRCTIHTMMFGLTRIGFYSGDMDALMDDIQTLRPTTMIAVPRLLNRIYDSVAAATVGAGGLTGMLSRIGYRRKLRRINAGRGPRHALWDRLVFGKVAARFGGRLQALFCGAASVRPEVLTFFRACLSCTVIQGYGQTECAVSGTLQLASDTAADNAGVPPPGVEIRLRSMPEMGYQVTDLPCARGELLIRGPNVSSGYLKEPAKWRESMDGSWLLTGDIAQLNPDGTITIIDRAKSIIKTGQGVWVAPERIESVYTKHPLVKSMLVHGAEDQRDLVAVVVPDAEKFVPWARRVADVRKGAAEPPLAALCAQEEVVAALLRELRELAAASGLLAAEHIAAIHCEPEPFESRCAEFQTSTYKLRRRVVLEHYQSALDGLYSDLDGSTASTITV
ncbi:medium-chain fatty acid-CoA ligase faa2 [Coemansia javaensis]|uniref:Medium-chain fatty acid-CoA ligase faa2 n=1 Tax=Coemansia javaensis TaxID=2761396 RepID=A0A9W8HI86_9FUNG|nr:medium-chain fatty acid-CoA ligase faa2 [Coemansia javaensis]